MKRTESVTLLISTYNNPLFLKLCLLSVMSQSILPTEVVIADDGSTEETYQLIQRMKTKLKIPIIHVWQEDQGFRAGTIRNIGIAAANGDYIIQIDGDIIIDKHFIADHLYHRKKNTLLQGSRVFITQNKTAKMIKDKDVNLSFWSLGIKRRENALRSRFISTYLSTRYRNRYPVYYARGCNMSFWKKDLIAVNGYNDEFIGWGHEDSELTLRLLNNGCKKDYIKFHCVAYHLYHKEATRNHEKENKQKMDQQVAENKKWCNSGVNKFIETYADYIK